MRIGIDIDETLTDTEKSFYAVIEKYKIDFKKTYKEKWTKSDFKLLTNYLDEILGNAKFKKGSREAINILNQQGHELYIITARGNNYSKNIISITKKMLEKNKLVFKNMYFNCRKKSDIAKKLNIDLMIDDSQFVYENMKKENIDCILFGDKFKKGEEVLEYINRKG